VRTPSGDCCKAPVAPPELAAAAVRPEERGRLTQRGRRLAREDGRTPQHPAGITRAARERSAKSLAVYLFCVTKTPEQVNTNQSIMSVSDKEVHVLWALHKNTVADAGHGGPFQVRRCVTDAFPYFADFCLRVYRT
jgi:hypothetical protein